MTAQNLDLHSLESLDMFMREKSVLRAAQRLGISQSSASEMLGRLRERFDDQLLVRGREGMVATPKAQALWPEIRIAIAQLRSLLDQGQEFRPAEAALRFRLTASDYAQLLVLPQLCSLVENDAPGCAIDIVPTNILRLEDGLNSGGIDLAIAYYPDPPAGLRRSPLFRDDYVCIARNGHAAGLADLDAAGFATLSHISVAPSGLAFFSSVVDSALEAQGLARRVSVTSPHFLLAAHLVSKSNMVLSLPRGAARHLAELLPIQIIEIPLPMRSVEVAMYWHERTHQSPPHQWLRAMVRQLCASMADPVLATT